MATVENLREVVSYPSKVKITVDFDEKMNSVTAREYFEKYREEGEIKSDVDAITYAMSKTDEIATNLDIPKMLYIPVEFSLRKGKVLLLGFDEINVEETDTVTIDDTYVDDYIVTVTILKGGEER